MTTDTAPWPIVGECYYPAPSLVAQNHSCTQCDGSHDHEWVAWKDPDETALRFRVGSSIPVRCRVCGGRKCDIPECMLRRHHSPAPHETY